MDKDEQFQRKKGEYVQVEQLLAEYRARKEIIEEHRSVSEELEKENRMKII